jgi:hypothetical protein
MQPLQLSFREGHLRRRQRTAIDDGLQQLLRVVARALSRRAFSSSSLLVMYFTAALPTA